MRSRTGPPNSAYTGTPSARLDVEQGVLDRADGLLDHAAGGLAAQRGHQGDVRFPGTGILADQGGSELRDDRGDPGTAEGLVVLAPPHDPFVGADLEEVEIA